MSVLFYPESIRILGSDANGNSVMLCKMAVDDIANLPAANDFINDGYVLSMGCKAIVINDNSVHRLNSAGQWVQIAAGTSTYTRAEIDAMLSAIDVEIGAVANDGAKNRFAYLNYTAGQTATASGRKFTILSDGGIRIENAHSGTGNYADLYLSGTWAGTSTVFSCGGASYRASIQAPDVASGSKQYVILKLYDRHTGVTVEYIDPSAASDGEDFSFDATVAYISIHKNLSIPSGGIVVYPMIRRAEISDPTYEPYAPTNRQLYEMILQLQGG